MDKANLLARHAAVLTERRASVRHQLDHILPKSSARFTWEVGSGHGHFLNAYAAAHPEKLCIGVDIESERIARAEKKRDRTGVANLHFIRAEARLFLESLPQHALIDEAFILFPDPWPKLRHHKHRLVQPAFLKQLAVHAAPNCPLYFRTDYHPYYVAALASVHASSDWEIATTPWPFEHETVFQSRAARHDSFVARKRSP